MVVAGKHLGQIKIWRDCGLCTIMSRCLWGLARPNEGHRRHRYTNSQTKFLVPDRAHANLQAGNLRRERLNLQNQAGIATDPCAVSRRAGLTALFHLRTMQALVRLMHRSGKYDEVL